MKEIKISQMGTRSIFILPILVAVTLFGLTFSSCKDCDKAEDKGKDDPVIGKTTSKPYNPAVPGNPILPSDNLISNALLCQLAVKEAQDAESRVKSAMIKAQGVRHGKQRMQGCRKQKGSAARCTDGGNGGVASYIQSS
jgi:hypothetical protein